MKNILKHAQYILMIIFVLSACTDTKDPIYQQGDNPVLNSPTGYYTLTIESKPFIMETFTWSKGEYGFDAAPTFTVQASLNENFTDSVELASANATFASVTVAKMNAVMLNWKCTPSVPKNVYIRIKAVLNSAETVITYSEPTIITVIPFKDLAPTKAPLYIVGSTLNQDAQWKNTTDAIGTGLIPLFTDVNDTKDLTYTYTGYFKAGGFKVIVEPGTWGAQQYGLKNGNLVKEDNCDNFTIPADGYYTFSMDAKAMTFSLSSYDASGATTYTSIGLIGAFNSWGGDFALSAMNFDPHIWSTIFTQEATGELKFRANNGWGINWGSTSLPFGIGALNGSNITLEKGKYYVQINTITGHYMFLPVK
ncbi:SusE domain-containing protein [Parabacteroides sp. FAFU027]|uniref:SusE domain-containing protein n=1 Tax=Parabacteroides sp. FAFU027 TaxID=2922715 RepID=UPI001FB01A89|nr:SusE domain-containing protein [Parabacteroides sp. FAFU027]